jgi:hypothetical protein
VTLLAATAGCGQAPTPSEPAEARDGELRRFQFVRATKLLLRLDTQLGVVWKVATSGDGGWSMLGATPADDDEPSWNGRYGLFALKSGALGGPPHLLRVDRANGRAWLTPAQDGSRWTPIQEGPDPETPEPRDGAEAGDGKTTRIPVASKEVIQASVGEESEKVAVVVRALEKKGLPLEIKVWAASQLSVFSPEAAVPPLLKALKSEHPEVIVAAIQSLKTLGRPSTIPKILALSQHPDASVREAVQAVIVAVP